MDVLKNRNVIVSFNNSFIGVGIFTAYLTYVEAVLEEHELSMETTGLTASAFLIGGISGSIVIPVFSDKAGRRKPSLYICFILSTFLFYAHTLVFGE